MSTVRIAGGAMTSFSRRKDGSSYRDWAREAFCRALADAALEVADIDTLIIASESDFFTAQISPSAILADELGLTNATALRVEGCGASGQLAVHVGAAMALSGQARRTAVIGVEASASHLVGKDTARVHGAAFDTWTDGMTAIDATSLYGLSAQIFMSLTEATSRDFAEIAVRNRQNACANPFAHLPLEITSEDVMASRMIAMPYHKLDCSPLSDGASCVILGLPDHLPEFSRGRARIVGMGSANDRARIGERSEPGRFLGKRSAARKAFQQAGIVPADIDLAEVYDPYSGAQLQALDGLGLSENAVADERSGRFTFDGDLPVNLSGGLLGQGAPAGAIGVAQILACALQVEGRYFGMSPKNIPAYALADAHGGIGTVCAVTVIGGGET